MHGQCEHVYMPPMHATCSYHPCGGVWWQLLVIAHGMAYVCMTCAEQVTLWCLLRVWGSWWLRYGVYPDPDDSQSGSVTNQAGQDAGWWMLWM